MSNAMLNDSSAQSAVREIQIRDALKEAMTEEMVLDERVFLVGEEVGHYNGAYKCSKGMLEQLSTPRSLKPALPESASVLRWRDFALSLNS